MLSDKTVLVIEAEFLAAIELQRLIERAHAAKTVFLRQIEEAASLPSLAEFDLAIVEMPAARGETMQLLTALRAIGVAVVVTSADPGLRNVIPGFAGVPVLRKPFEEIDLLTACTLALAANPPGDGNNPDSCSLS